jgi:hypothetical protein
MTTSAPVQDPRPAPLLPPQGWRGLARLALEGLAAGVFVSVVLALAVFIVASRADAAPLRAQGLRRGRCARRHAQALAAGDEPAVSAPLVATDVRIEVAGIVARTTLTQRFVNPTPVWREGVYLFPLPDKAAVDHMRVETGGRVIEGEVHERAKAKQAYDDANAPAARRAWSSRNGRTCSRPASRCCRPTRRWSSRSSTRRRCATTPARSRCGCRSR